jgi:hypothetical protein
MAKLSYGVFIATVFVIMGAIVGRMFVSKVAPDEIGVRTQEFGFLGDKGIYPHDYDTPGWYRNIWFVDRWYKFDRSVQTLRMLLPLGSPIRGDEGPTLQIKSKDGYDVIVNLRVKYRIKHGEAHLLLDKLGDDPDRFKRIVLNEATDACRIEFGEMETEEFYNPDKREKSANDVQARLQKKLDDRHLEVIEILISQIKFDEQYEQKIRDKKLADQDVEVSKSRGEAEDYKGKTRVVEAQTSALLQKIRAEQERTIAQKRGGTKVQITETLEEAKAFSVERKSDADLLLQQARAKADLLLRTAEADGEKARVAAMSGEGGRIIVALEAARNLKIKAVDFSTLGVDVLDVEAMAEKLGAPR